MNSQVHLLLNRLISTSGAKMGLIWISETDSFYTIPQYPQHTITNLKYLVSFLRGYYYTLIRVGHNSSPIIVEDLLNTLIIPKNLIGIPGIEDVTTFLISPILHNKRVKGNLILGADNVKGFYNIDSELLKSLSDILLKNPNAFN